MAQTPGSVYNWAIEEDPKTIYDDAMVFHLGPWQDGNFATAFPFSLLDENNKLHKRFASHITYGFANIDGRLPLTEIV